MMNILLIKYFNIQLNYLHYNLNKVLDQITIYKKYFNYSYQILLLEDIKNNLIYKETNQYYKIINYYKNRSLMFMTKNQIISYKSITNYILYINILQITKNKINNYLLMMI